jgi:hypothetical protein
MPIPFSKAEFPELDGLASEERRKILEKCCQSPEMEKLSRQQTVVIRLAMFPMLLMIPILFWGSDFGLQAKHLFLLGSFAMGLFIAAFIGTTLVYHKQSSRLLQQLIAKEIASTRINRSD